MSFPSSSGFASQDPNGVPPYAEALMEVAMEASLLQLSLKAEATGAGFADYIALETEFTIGLGVIAEAAGGVLPRDDPAVFKMFLGWLCLRKERALSLDTIWRAAGSVMARTRERNLTKLPEVKAFYESLRELHGQESAPRTATTRRMIRIIMDELIDRVASARTAPRVKLMFALEVMCGLRVGEVLTGGDFHGLQANNLVILTNQATGAESVECFLEHSKTKHRRWVNAVGVSEGAARVRLAAAVRAFWEDAGLSLVTRLEGGFRVEGPDYSVLRLSLVGLTGSRGGEELDRACRVLSRSACSEVRRWASFTRLRGEERRVAAHSLDRRYVNVTGGARGCSSIAAAARDLTLAGFGDMLEIVPGPLMRSTHGATLGMTHMPLNPTSTYDQLHALMDEAYKLANPSGDPDPELDLSSARDGKPLWGHHSNRRGADTVARQTMELTGATEEDIDLTFGWQEAMYSKKMQIHYEGRFTRDRRTNVTRMM